jgi:hypothetical protein
VVLQKTLGFLTEENFHLVRQVEIIFGMVALVTADPVLSVLTFLDWFLLAIIPVLKKNCLLLVLLFISKSLEFTIIDL